jgi:hypothetical protein
MSNIVNANKCGLVFGALFGGFHIVWSLIVLGGFGQMLVSFIFWAHMMQLPIVVGPFDAIASLTLIVITAVIGYVFGYVMGLLWNRIHGA